VRGHITLKQYEAGLDLFLDFEDSNIPPGAVSDPSRIFVDGGAWRDFLPACLDSHRRLQAAFARVEGKTARRMIFDVCCLGHMLSAGLYGHYIDSRARMACLKEGLDELVSFYSVARRTH
jgi:hypothetical protein